MLRDFMNPTVCFQGMKLRVPLSKALVTTVCDDWGPDLLPLEGLMRRDPRHINFRLQQCLHVGILISAVQDRSV